MEKLQIPTAVQELLDSINATKLNLGEIKIDKHPLVSQDLDRYIQINKISIDLNLPRTYIWYSQILKDSEGNIDSTYPFKIPNKDSFTKDGKRISENKNPSIFPATIEWYNILKTAYPDLKPPKTNIRILLSRKTTEFYEIEIKESNPRIAKDVAIEMLKDSTDGFKVISKDSSISLYEWEKK